MKRRHAVVTLFVAVLLYLGVGHGQAATLTIDMVPGGGVDASRTQAPGDSFTVDVLVDGALDLAGFQFDVVFDPAILSATSITSGNLFGLDTFPVASTISNGSLSFAETTLAPAGIDVSASAVLASIQFMVLAEGTSGLDLVDFELVDSAVPTGLINVSSAAGGQLLAQRSPGVPSRAPSHCSGWGWADWPSSDAGPTASFSVEIAGLPLAPPVQAGAQGHGQSRAARRVPPHRRDALRVLPRP